MKPIPLNNPANPWSAQEIEYFGEAPEVALSVYEDTTREILAENDSPDVGFRWSMNPYRGCFHGCAYCYARPTHEYLGFGSGTDFERKIVVKPQAAALLRAAFERRSWRGELVMLSGNTDCYQPLEARYRLTRACLEVFAEYRNPVHVITKSPLVERDLDLLQELASVQAASVSISIPFWNEDHARALEPYVTTPQRRMVTVRRLSEAGIAVTVNVAPLVPGLNDREMPSVLEAAAAAGARSAALVFLRLPGNVKTVFTERLREQLPLTAEKVLTRTREMRGGKLYESRFGARMSAEGEYARAIRALFDKTAERLGLCSGEPRAGEATPFRRPSEAPRQLRLF